MILEPPADARSIHTVTLACDLCVVGGGMAGVCAAITAARAGVNVVLMQDRPVLGGNASSEVRLWVLGATSHLHSNNRWSREGGVINEILVENFYRNPEGNPLLFDMVVLDAVQAEPNITLLLNTAAHEVRMAQPGRIAGVRGFNAQNSTLYNVSAPLFCDASGDGIVGFASGAAFRMGAETMGEFGEKAAPDDDYGHLLGHSIYFYTKDVGKPVKFVPPACAIRNVPGRIPRYRGFNAAEQGCKLWWIEYGGRLDTVHETETIKHELWRVVYGVWDYIKNSGKFPEAQTLTLEWVGHIPGKRESRRFEGDMIMNQLDVVERRKHDDAVAYTGWAIDLHPADGVYSDKAGCTQWKFQGLAQIPYRCLYSRNVENLFLSGRIISVSHVAFGTTRVMATCAHGGQAVGMAAAICTKQGLLPRDLSMGDPLKLLQRELMRTGQHIPHHRLNDPDDLTQTATITATSELQLCDLPDCGESVTLECDSAMLLPVESGKMPKVTAFVDVTEPTELVVELRTAERPDEFTPSITRASHTIRLAAGENQPIDMSFDAVIDQARYVFVCLMANPHVRVRLSDQRITGVLSLWHRRTSESAKDIGVQRVEIWTAERRPGGKNWACRIDPPLAAFAVHQIANGVQRPTNQTNAWVAAFDDESPAVTLKWDSPRTIRRIEVFFDVDYDHPMESAQWDHPELTSPFCVKHYRVVNEAGVVLHECRDNHHARNTVVLDEAVTTDTLTVQVIESHDAAVPAAVFEVRAYA